MLSMIKRGLIEDPAVVAEFEHLIGRLRGFLSQSFDEDGNLVVADPNLAVVPLGGCIPFTLPSTEVPTGWLLCDGRQVNRVTYRSYFEKVGTTFGVGDGSTTFNIPDMRQRFPLGVAASGTGNALGATGGNIDHTHSGGSHTHSISSGGSHSHTVNSHSHTISSDGSHNHGGATGASAGGTLSGLDANSVDTSPHTHSISSDGTHTHGGGTGSTSPGTSSDGSHDHGGTTGSASGTTGTANPPFVALNYIVYVGV